MRYIIFNKILKILLYTVAIPIIFLVRVLKPFILLRFGIIEGSRIGHFAANPEIYLCEKKFNINQPQKICIDLFCIHPPIVNSQLAKMWKRRLKVCPTLLISPIIKLNRLFTGSEFFEVGCNTEQDRDVHNLLDKTKSDHTFTEQEEFMGNYALMEMGVKSDAEFACLIVRDSAYFDDKSSRHGYRNNEIKNFELVSNVLTMKGCYVIRMGAKVLKEFNLNNPLVIDYASSGKRSEFMDIFLAAKCKFCITTGVGWDSVPAWMFRKPTIYVNYGVIGMAPTFSNNFLFIPKLIYDKTNKRLLTLSETFELGYAYIMDSEELLKRNLSLRENTSEEISDAVMEMYNRLCGNWVDKPGYHELQENFSVKFEKYKNVSDFGKKMHGKIRSRVGTKFLLQNKAWLED